MDIKEIEHLETLVALSEDYHHEIQNTLKSAVLSILRDMKEEKVKRDKDRCPCCGNRIEYQKGSNLCGSSGVSDGVLD